MIEDLKPQPDIWESNPKLKSLLLVLIAVFLISGIGLAVFAQVQNNYRQKVYEDTVNGLPKHQTGVLENQKIGELDVANWKIYRNEDLGFEFKYPEDWGLSEGLEDGKQGVRLFKQTDGTGSAAVTISKGKLIGSLKDFINSNNEGLNVLLNSIVEQPSGNWIYQIVQDKKEPTIQFISVYIENSRIRYTINSSSRYSDVSEKLINNILSTFKFTPTP